MKTTVCTTLLVVTLFVFSGCDLVDPMRPSIHADTETFGNLLETRPDPTRSDAWIINIRVGVPRALGRGDEAQPTPDVAGGILAVVSVTSDTVVIVDDRPGAVEEIGPGTEVVAIPVPGSTTMFGEKEIHLEAAQLMDFRTYARWRLPNLEIEGQTGSGNEDPNRINSAGIESGPVPVGDGSVFYFSARLRPPEVAGGEWIGARRDGIAVPAEGQRSFERSFRTELGESGWSIPVPVMFPGADGAAHVKVTWVSDDERLCYVTVSGEEASPWVGVAERSAKGQPWSELMKMDATGDGDAFDAIAMVASPEKTVFGTTRAGSGDLFLHDPAIGAAQALQPEINTAGLEWAPRVGPANELYFVRGDRQLRFQSGRVGEVRLPGPHRIVIIEGAPTPDGEWFFFATPKLRPVELDLDIHVAPIAEDGALGQAVPVDDWRP